MATLDIRCCYKTSTRRLKVPADSSFGDVKSPCPYRTGSLDMDTLNSPGAAAPYLRSPHQSDASAVHPTSPRTERDCRSVAPLASTETLPLRKAAQWHATSLVPFQTQPTWAQVLAGKAVGLNPTDFKLLWRGKERADGDAIYASGVKDGAKLHVAETEEYRRRHGAELVAEGVLPSTDQVPAAPKDFSDKDLARVEEMDKEVDPLETQVEELREAAGKGGQGQEDWAKRHKMLLELLTRHLLKLDQFECSGTARERRKQVINRVNSLCEALEGMSVR